MSIIYFHRNLEAGYSINKVTQTIVRGIPDKQEYYVPYMGASVKTIVQNLLYVWRHRAKHSIHHITGDIHYCILALLGCKSVLTIHDTVSLEFNQLPWIKKLIMEWLWFRIPLRLASKVVCISDETKRCVQKYTGRKDIVVIHNAIDPIFEEVAQHANHDVPHILLIGTTPNKNLIRTFEALQGICCKCTIIGKLDEQQLNALKLYHINYENRLGLSDAQIVEEYAKADIVSFISLFEGFGMIVIEANQVGRPVICSDIPVLKEVAGDAALFVNPLDVKDMRRGFERLMSEPDLCQTLVERGRNNVRRFDVSAIRQQWQALYAQI